MFGFAVRCHTDWLDPRGCSVENVHLLPLACWHCGFESCRDMGARFLCLLCVVRYRSLRPADHSSRGFLPSVVCLSMIVKPRLRGGPGPLGVIAPWGGDWMTPEHVDQRSVITANDAVISMFATCLIQFYIRVLRFTINLLIKILISLIR
jgi:hypothetical protein